MEFYSHLDPKTLLIDHLREVAERAQNYFYFNSKEDLNKIAYLLGLTHDFGKYTTYFQDRLHGRKDPGKLADHGFISSLYTAYTLSKAKEKLNIGEELKEFLPLISSFVVYHHHLDLTDLDNFDAHLEEDYLEKVKAQIENMKENRQDIEKDLVELGLPTIEEFEQNLNKTVDEIKRLHYKYENYLLEKEKEKISILTLALFSALIDADKKSAGKVKEIDRKSIPENIVEIHKSRKFKNSNDEINELREEIFENITKKVESLDIENKKIFSLTAPTGSGKTLTGFAFAVKLRKRIEEKYNYTPRIIYSLPFISIIDQNYKILYEVLSNIENFEGNSSTYIIGHHHLSNIEYEEGNEFEEVEKALSLIESWESEVIVTTFVQLLHSVIGFKNKFLKKYHNIARSIIILDEAQNVPAEYWELIRRVFKLMTQYLNCYIILMTATRPLIFHDNEIEEILDQKEKYFRSLSRVILKPRLEERKIPEFLPLFEEIYKPDKSYLIVANTINSSIDIYNLLEKKNFENLYYLSANLISKHKLERINDIKNKLENGEKVILVSTQVVEAGVDLDFDITIRDLGPLDSIVQVAGRCNRNLKKGKNSGEVYVLNLKDEKNRSLSTYVYSKILPSISQRILEEIKEIEEAKFLELVDQYFKRIREIKSFEDSEKIFQALLDLRFFSKNEFSVSSFNVIQEKGTIYPVFIEYDEEAKKTWRDYKEIIEMEGEIWEKKKRLLEIKKQFEDYIVNVRVQGSINEIFGIIFEKGLGYVPHEKVQDFYDEETGFKKDLKNVSALIL